MTPHPWPPPVDSVPAGIVPGILHDWSGPVERRDPFVNEWEEGVIERDVLGRLRVYRLGRAVTVDAGDVRIPLARHECRYALARALNAYHLLPRADGGSLPDEFAGHSAALLCCDAWRKAAGMGPLMLSVVPAGVPHTAPADADRYALILGDTLLLSWPASRPEVSRG